MRFIFMKRGFEATGFLNFLLLTGMVRAEQSPTDSAGVFKSEFYEENERCFSCHGDKKYSYFNPVTEKTVTAEMWENRVFKREDFYSSNHKSFACVDCHSADYDSFPHPGNLRMEEKYNCSDCHAFDEKYAHFNFEKIEEEFNQSVHYLANSEEFTCWKCHNPHTYKINIRTSKNISDAIAYDNQMCLNCHSDFDRFQLLTERKEINILEKHDWLPNQSLHFSQVRCIECHARQNDTLMVAHRIMPKEQAVKNCVECHSQNSLLMSSLYKFQAKENRTEAGFLNAIMLNNAFVIGANRNIWLNRISVIAFGLSILVLLGHLAARIIFRKKTENHG
jgi:hypothetical protein